MRQLTFAVMVLLLHGCGRDEPRFVSALLPEDTTDTVGPYRIETEVYAPNGVYRLLVRVESGRDGGGFGELAFTAIDERSDGGSFFVELPGRPVNTVTRYYLQLVDGKRTGGGAIAVLPEGAPDELAAFAVRAVDL